MKKTFCVTLLIAALLAACVPAPAPTPTVDAVATAQFVAAATLTAQATATPIPSATQTLQPTPTQTRPPKATATPKPTKTPKPHLFIGCFAPNGIAGKTAPFKLEVFGNRKATVFINGTSRNGDHTVYCTEVVKQGLPVEMELMWGDYTYMIQMGTSTRKGSFFINDDDKATMRIFPDKIQIGPFQ